MCNLCAICDCSRLSQIGPILAICHTPFSPYLTPDVSFLHLLLGTPAFQATGKRFRELCAHLRYEGALTPIEERDYFGTLLSGGTFIAHHPRDTCYTGPEDAGVGTLSEALLRGGTLYGSRHAPYPPPYPPPTPPLSPLYPPLPLLYPPLPLLYPPP